MMEKPTKLAINKNGLEHCVCQNNHFATKNAVAQIVAIAKKSVFAKKIAFAQIVVIEKKLQQQIEHKL